MKLLPAVGALILVSRLNSLPLLDSECGRESLLSGPAAGLYSLPYIPMGFPVSCIASLPYLRMNSMVGRSVGFYFLSVGSAPSCLLSLYLFTISSSVDCPVGIPLITMSNLPGRMPSVLLCGILVWQKDTVLDRLTTRNSDEPVADG